MKTQQKSNLSATVAQVNMDHIPAQGYNLQSEEFLGNAVLWLSRNKDPKWIPNLLREMRKEYKHLRKRVSPPTGLASLGKHPMTLTLNQIPGNMSSLKSPSLQGTWCLTIVNWDFLKKKKQTTNQIWASILCGKWRTTTVSLLWETFKDLRWEPNLHKTLKTP